MIDLFVQLAILIFAIILLWILLRMALRLTAKIFSCGCSLILLAGILAVLYMLFFGS